MTELQVYTVTHETENRRVRWVHDNDYETVGSYGYDTEEETRKAEEEELEGLQSGRLVVLGAVAEYRRGTVWECKDSLWGIVVPVGGELEELGNELLEIPSDVEREPLPGYRTLVDLLWQARDFLEMLPERTGLAGSTEQHAMRRRISAVLRPALDAIDMGEL